MSALPVMVRLPGGMLADAMHGAWVAFAATGTPAGPGTNWSGEPPCASIRSRGSSTILDRSSGGSGRACRDDAVPRPGRPHRGAACHGCWWPPPYVLTAKIRHSLGTPFSSCMPRSSNAIPEPATRSLTVLETSTSPPRAIAEIRAPIWTASPNTVDLKRENPDRVLPGPAGWWPTAMLGPFDGVVRHLALDDAGVDSQATGREDLEQDLVTGLGVRPVKGQRGKSPGVMPWSAEPPGASG